MVSPVTAGLAINLSAKSFTGVVNDGGTFTDWPDISGNANHALGQGHTSGGFNPTYYASRTPIGGPTVRLYGATQKFTNQNIYSSSTSGEVFIVFLDGGTNTQGLYQFGGGDWTYTPWVDNNIYDGSFTNTRYSFPAVSPSSYHIYNVSHDGTQRVTRIDGVVVHTVTVGFVNPGAATYSQLLLGSIAGATWVGDIAEFIAYSRSLTSTERAQVYSYLRGQHFSAAADPNVDVPPVAATLAILGTVSSPAPAPINAPPVALTAAVHGIPSAYGFELVQAPPMAAALAVYGHVASASIRLTSPADGSTVEAANPQFVVALNAHDQNEQFTIAVQYADNSAFTGATSLTSTATAIDGGAFLAPSTPVAASTFWQARLIDSDGDVVVDWTPAIHFTVDTDLTPTDLSVTWSIGSAARPIHLWHVVPASAAPGDGVTAYGQGFPTTGHILLDGTPCTVTRWQRMPAVIDSIQPDRQIDTDEVDPEHYEIDFIVPATQPPGGILEVTA